jgi:hypothetical protein
MIKKSDNRSDSSSIISTTSTLMSANGISGAKAPHQNDGGASTSTVSLGSNSDPSQNVKDAGAAGVLTAATDNAEPRPTQSSGIGRDSRDSNHDEKEKSAVSDSDMIDGRPRDVYDRFSPGRKKVIMAIVSYSAFISREFATTYK